MDTAIRCTRPACKCASFAPGRGSKLICSSCHHGWISHALDKLLLLDRHLLLKDSSHRSRAYDLASLILFGATALPIRLKILLETLLAKCPKAEVDQLLASFGWTPEDLARGYITKDPEGVRVIRWTIVNSEDESLVMQHFLRFAETQSIADGFLRDEGTTMDTAVPGAAAAASKVSNVSPLIDSSNMAKFMERANTHSDSQSKCSNSTTNALSAAVNSPTHRVAGGGGGVASPLGPSASPESSSAGRRASLSPTVKPLSPSALIAAAYPLDRLQNMQPFDQTSCHKLLNSSNNSSSSKNTDLARPPNDTHNLTSQMQPLSQLTSPGGNLVASDQSLSDGSGDETTTSEGAVNLSLINCSDKERGHSRKSSNPMKRRWNPMVLSTMVTNPATGKRRVQCHACFKTFCDKGALKIHFSAVHLREMHKCTRPGCSMMFSSRRSRNRHSANPNPKLHSSSLRRKLNPHDGRSSNPFPNPLLAPASPLLNLTTSNSSLMSKSAAAAAAAAALLDQRFGDQSTDPSSRVNFSLSGTTNTPGGLGDHHHNHHHHHHLKSATGDSFRSSSCSPCPSDAYESEPGSSTPKKFKSHGDLSRHLIAASNGHSNNNNNNNNNNSLSLNLSNSKNKQQSENLGGECDARSRKRKSANPTKFSVPHSPGGTSEDEEDLQYSSDDSSSGTFMDSRQENGLGEELSDEDDDDEDDEDDSLQEYSKEYLLTRQQGHRSTSLSAFKVNNSNNKREGEEGKNTDQENGRHQLDNQTSQAITAAAASVSPSSAAKTTTATSTAAAAGSTLVTSTAASSSSASASAAAAAAAAMKNSFNSPSSSNSSNNSKATATSEQTVNPLRHLESLSLGHFSNLINANSQLKNPPPAPSLFASNALPLHSPGLVEMAVGKNKEPIDKEATESNESCPKTGAGGQDDQESGQERRDMLSMFHESSSSIDIPIDPQNPRKCPTCNKVFQNHFGVKTHYQNVHLKLMHKCTVDGCNAAFPSKRSRDRHSANLNLHRKLLSTHTDKGLPFSLDKSSHFSQFPYAPAADFLSRFYDPQGLPMNLSELYHSGRIPPLAAAAAGPLVPGLLATPFGFGFGPPGVSAAALSAGSSEMANSTGRDSPPASASPDSSVDNRDSHVIKCSANSKQSKAHPHHEDDQDDDEMDDDLEERDDDEGQATSGDHHRSPPQSTSRSKAVCEISC